MSATLGPEAVSSALFALVSPADAADSALPDVLPAAIDREDFRTTSFTPESFLAERRVGYLDLLHPIHLN